jgi:hypothetical protein
MVLCMHTKKAPPAAPIRHPRSGRSGGVFRVGKRGDGAVDGGAAAAENARDLGGAFRAAEHLRRLADLLAGEHPLAPEMMPAGSRRLEPGDGALPHHVPLELRDGSQDGVQHPPGGRGGVDVVGEGAEGDLALPERLGHVEEMPERPPEAIELPDHQRIAGADGGEGFIQPRPRAKRPGGGGVLEDRIAAGGAQGVVLKGRGLFVGGDPSVADQAGVKGRRPLGRAVYHLAF